MLPIYLVKDHQSLGEIKKERKFKWWPWLESH